MKTTEVIVKNEEPLIFGDSIKIVGDVEIRNGNTVIRAKNRFVQTMLQWICNLVSFGNQGQSGSASGVQGPWQSPNMYVGTDTTTATVYNTTILTTQIGGAPNLLIGNTSNPSNGVFQISVTATWQAGTLPENPTIGEMALYLALLAVPDLRGFASTGNITGSTRLATRLSVADGSFIAFTLDSTKPLAITWTIRVTFS